MNTLFQDFQGEIANVKFKAEKRLRAMFLRGPRYLTAGLEEALKLISFQSKRIDWPKVSVKIHFNDGMYEGNPTSYFLSGYSALFCIQKALEKAGKKSVSSVLDFACGHGRVLRSLAGNFPEARLVAIDSNKAGVDFCAQEFGAEPVYSSIDFSTLAVAGKFDLIWVGSLFTHLSAERWPILLKLLRSVMARDGLLVFSTHGRDAERRLRERQVLLFNLQRERITKILEEYDGHGFGYSDYERHPGYGVSLSSPRWVTRQANAVALQPILHQEKGWDDFQDVWATSTSVLSPK